MSRQTQYFNDIYDMYVQFDLQMILILQMAKMIVQHESMYLSLYTNRIPS